MKELLWGGAGGSSTLAESRTCAPDLNTAMKPQRSLPPLSVFCLALALSIPSLQAVDHFVFSNIPSPQYTNLPISVTITAATSQGTTDTSFNGSCGLSAAGQNGTDLLQPTSIGPFISGVWTGMVQVLNTDRFVQLQTLAAPGLSVPFHVEPAPYRTVSLQALDLAWDPGTQQIYASVPSDASAYANSITAIDPVAGTIVSSVPVEPIIRPITSVAFKSGKIAKSDDSQYLYVAVSNAFYVRRYNLATRTLGPFFTLGTEPVNQALSVSDMVVLPGSPTSVAVAKSDAYNSYAVAIYDNGVQRPTTTSQTSFINKIEPSASPNLLYGFDNQSTGFELFRLAVNSSGVTVQDSTTGLLNGFSTDFKFNGGLVFGDTGPLVNPQKPALIGTFSLEGFGPMVAPDTGLGRAFFLTYLGGDSHYHLQAHDVATLLPLKALDIPNDGGATAFIRWGTNGLAFSTSTGKIYLVQSSLLTPGASPVADLTVTQSVASTPLVGSNFVLSVTVSNQGPDTASEVALTDSWPTNWNLVSLSLSQGSWTSNSSGVKCNFGMVPPTSNATLTATFNTAIAGWQSNRVFAVANETDPNLTNNISGAEYFIGIDAEPNTISQIALPTGDLAYDPNSQTIFASIPSRAGVHGNALLSLQPNTGIPLNSFFVGNEPGRLVSSGDHSILYAAANANQSICPVNLGSQTVGSSFPLGTNSFGATLYLEDMAALPGQPQAIAVSREVSAGTASGFTHEAIAVYDNGIQRPNTGSAPSEYYSDVIKFGADSSILFAHNSGAVGFLRLQVDNQGVTFLDSDSALLGNFNGIGLEYAQGNLYSTAGPVIDPLAEVAIGRVPGITNSAAMLFDPSTRRLFYLQMGASNYVLQAFEAGSFLPLGNLSIPGVLGTPSSLIRWGADGLAFRTSGDQLFILRTSLVPTNPPADLAITLSSADGAAIVASNYVFSLQVTNGGPATAADVLVTNALPFGATNISVTLSQGVWFNASGSVICDLGQMTNSAVATITISVQLSQSGLVSFVSSVAGSGLDVSGSNNQVAWMVWSSFPGLPVTQASSIFGVNDIAADRSAGIVYASVSSSAGPFANSVIPFAPVAGSVGKPMPFGPNPNRLALSADGLSLYAGLDDASAVQLLNVATQTPGLRFQLGSGQKTLAIAVSPTNSSQVVVYRTTDGKIAAYQNGLKLANELTTVNLFTYSAADATIYACDGSHSGVPLYSIPWSPSGLVLSTSQPAHQSQVTDLKSDSGLVFFGAGMVVNPNTQRVLAVMPVPGNSLVEPDVNSGRVFYLTPAGGNNWTLRAFDLAQAIEIASSPVGGLFGTPKRLFRCSADAFAICTDAGQLIFLRSPLVPTNPPTDLTLAQTSSSSAATTNTTLSFVLSLTNLGPNSAQSVVVTQAFSLPVTNVTLTPSTGSATFNTNQVTWQLGSLSSSATASLNVSLRAALSGTLMAVSTARHAANDPSWANNVAVSAVNVSATAFPSNSLQLRFGTRELVYDPFRNVIYASFAATNQLLGNVIGIISPATGSLLGTLFAGSEPDQLALSQDGHFLYASLDGTMGIRRFDLTGALPSFEFPLSLAKTYNVFDLKVQPGQPHTFAVSRVNTQSSSYPESVAVYDDNVPRTNTAGITKPIVFSPDGTRLYGSVTLGMGLGFLRLQVDSNGVTQLSQTTAYNGDADFDIANGLVYGSTGIVLDPTVPVAVGTNKASGPLTADGHLGRVFYIAQIGTTNFELRSFPLNPSQSLGTNSLPGILGTPGSLIRCGIDRLAFRTTGNQVFIFHTPLIPLADLSLSGTSSPSLVVAGQTFTVNLSLTNLGPAIATNVVITNLLAGMATVQSATSSQGSYAVSPGSVVWNLGSLASNATASASLVLLATNSVDMTFTNLLSAASDFPDVNLANNSLVLTNFLWANFRITSSQLLRNSPQLTFSSLTGHSFALEFSTNLTANSWTSLSGTIQAYGPQTTVSLPPPSPVGSGFYRIKLIQ
jgi:uncharacterized repeat protein (TIGR01451 family)